MNINYISCTDSMCGIARYLEELAAINFKKGNQVKLFRKFEGKHSFIQRYPHRSFKGLRQYIAPYFLSRAIKKSEANIWHSDYVDGATALMWANTSFSKSKIVITAHDAIPFIFKGSQTHAQFAYYKYHIQNTLLLADAVIVVSETSKNDFVKYTNIAPEKVHVIYNGINHNFFYPDIEKNQNDVFTIRYTGGLGKEHKNAIAIIETAKILEDRGINFRLELGSGNAKETRVWNLTKKYDLKNVYFPGFIPQTQLRSFLAEADLFIYPSLYEGFGFPPLEAMACGTAVLSSNKGSLGEILEDHALTMNPEPSKFADAVEELINDRNKLNELRINGIKHANKFSWENTAEKTLRLYENIL